MIFFFAFYRWDEIENTEGDPLDALCNGGRCHHSTSLDTSHISSLGQRGGIHYKGVSSLPLTLGDFFSDG